MRKYKCESCGGLFEHFAWRYDYSPRGDDVSFCPLCGCEEPDVEEVEEAEADKEGETAEEYKLTKEQWENLWDSGYLGDI